MWSFGQLRSLHILPSFYVDGLQWAAQAHPSIDAVPSAQSTQVRLLNRASFSVPAGQFTLQLFPSLDAVPSAQFLHYDDFSVFASVPAAHVVQDFGV